MSEETKAVAIRISDPVAIRIVEAYMAEIDDPKPSRTACRIIEQWARDRQREKQTVNVGPITP